MDCDVRIGTSGWHYKHWANRFYPAGLSATRMLDYYASQFDTVEVNNSFYRLPDAATFENWRSSTPPGFVFSVKASRFLTHMKKLRDPEQGLAHFLPRAAVLGEKLGPILFQLPPGWGLNLERLEAFLAQLPKAHRYGFELRHPGWHTPEVYALLRRYGAAYCIYELAGFRSPIQVTANFAYVRLHGPDGSYQGKYSRAALRYWANLIAAWRRKLSAIYLYFDNDQQGFAATNAAELKDLARRGVA